MPRLLGHPIGPDRRFSTGPQLRAIEHRGNEIFDAGIMQVGVRRKLLGASRIAEFRAVQRSERHFTIYADDPEFVAHNARMPPDTCRFSTFAERLGR